MAREDRPMSQETRELHEAIRKGSLDELRTLLDSGADVNSAGRLGRTPLMVAIEAADLQKLQLLLERGADPEITDDFNTTALGCAVSYDFVPAIKLLLELGVDRGYEPKYPQKRIDYRIPTEHLEMPNEMKSVMTESEWKELMEDSGRALNESPDELPIFPLITEVQSIEALQQFLQAGDRLGDVPTELKSQLLGIPDGIEFTASRQEFLRDQTRRFGVRNPELFKSNFWNDMVLTQGNGYSARKHFLGDNLFGAIGPVWCNQRYGASLTALTDGRYIQIGGEHEDFYDPDFCIYNDVIVFDGKGGFQIYGYPKDVFPPTDFHTATLVDEHIYVIGSLGYQDERKFGTTPVFRLNVVSLVIEEIATDGVAPGWIHKHLAEYDPESNSILISRGEVQVDSSAPPRNGATFSLDLSSLRWAKLD
ncbi:MAG: ankyrin repeat domain-containing protein [Pirellulaceae bacterium]|nr:ankyrin repeat domain-containing protein [Pirellulaceae bacterium]